MDVEVNAIRESDLRKFLLGTDLHERIESGLARCKICGSTVRWDDIGAVRIEGGAPVVVCSNGDCLVAAGAKQRDG